MSKAVSSIVAAVLIVLVIVFASVSGYLYVGSPKGGVSIVTSTVTQPGGSGGASTVTSVVTSTAYQNNSLISLAESQKTITIYGTMAASDWANTVQPAFLKSYPWATINYVSLPPAQISTRAISELQAGKVTADVLINSLGTMETAIQSGVVQQWNDSQYLYSVGYTANNTDPNAYWSPGWILPIVIIYNTHLVTAQNAPKSVSDLTNSQWNGKIVFQDPSVLSSTGSLFASLYPTMGNSSWTNLMKQIAANNPIVLPSADTVFADVSSGQYPVGVGFINDVISSQQQGNSSIGYVLVPPYGGVPNVAAITKDAPHNYMAQLMVQWLASVPGQVAIGNTGRPPQNNFVSASLLSKYVPSNVTLQIADYNNPSFYENSSTWSTVFHNIFG